MIVSEANVTCQELVKIHIEVSRNPYSFLLENFKHYLHTDSSVNQSRQLLFIVIYQTRSILSTALTNLTCNISTIVTCSNPVEGKMLSKI